MHYDIPDRRCRDRHPFTTAVCIPSARAETKVERQGHGFQRTLLISALQLLAQRGAAGGGSGVVFLAIEEPELFQHPLQARAFATVLRGLAEDVTKGIQVGYATHSPYFIEPRCFSQIRRVNRIPAPKGEEKGQPRVQVFSASEDEVISRLVGANKDNAKVRRQFDNVCIRQLPDALFADAVVLVEGETDRAVLEGVASREYPLFLDGVVVAEAGGKKGILFPLTILRLLGIPCYIVFDGDKDWQARSAEALSPEDIASTDNSHRNQNRSILAFCGQAEEDWPTNLVGANFAVFEDTLEFHQAVDIAQVVRELQAEEWKIEPEDLAEVSPYITENIKRFGQYSTHELAVEPEAYEPRLDIDFARLRDDQLTVKLRAVSTVLAC